VYGVKHYIDHEINSIQNFISPEIKPLYQMVDVNVYQENIFHTKMLLKAFDLHDYLFSTRLHTLSEARQLEISKLLRKEMREIYSGRNML
jgi:S-adenosylmethionine decarboxylase